MANTNQYDITCNDGTKDISNGAIVPCTSHGGVNEGKPNLNMKNMTTMHIALFGSGVLVGYLLCKFIKK